MIDWPQMKWPDERHVNPGDKPIALLLREVNQLLPPGAHVPPFLLSLRGIVLNLMVEKIMGMTAFTQGICDIAQALADYMSGKVYTAEYEGFHRYASAG